MHRSYPDLVFTSQTFPGLGYLSRTALLQGCARYKDSDLLKDDCSESEVVEDPALAHGSSSGFLICDQSITFSPTFQVPAFYFTIHDSRALLFGPRSRWIAQERGNTDGSLLTLEDIMNTSLLHRHALPEIQVTPYALVQPDASFPLLSQGDHPTLGTPAWFIHPCGTAFVVGELLGEKNAEGMPEDSDKWLRWLETWFMMMGNIVEL